MIIDQQSVKRDAEIIYISQSSDVTFFCPPIIRRHAHDLFYQEQIARNMPFEKTVLCNVYIIYNIAIKFDFFLYINCPAKLPVSTIVTLQALLMYFVTNSVGL